MELTDGQKSTRKALLKRVASDYYKRKSDEALMRLETGIITSKYKRSTQATKRLLNMLKDDTQPVSDI
jgi:hypothetical protein